MGSNRRRDEIAARTQQAEHNRQALADALITIEVFNSRLEHKRETWFWPTIGAALLTKYHWLTVLCQSCGTIVDLDLRVKRRHSGRDNPNGV